VQIHAFGSCAGPHLLQFYYRIVIGIYFICCIKLKLAVFCFKNLLLELYCDETIITSDYNYNITVFRKQFLENKTKTEEMITEEIIKPITINITDILIKFNTSDLLCAWTNACTNVDEMWLCDCSYAICEVVRYALYLWICRRECVAISISLILTEV